MSILRTKCAICEGGLINIYSLQNVPVNLSCVTPDHQYHFDELSFSQCNKCNTIQLDKLIPLHVLYQSSHNVTSVGKVWENYFTQFTNLLGTVVRNKTILEIGCPSGKLATKCEHFDKWYIVDPNKNETVKFSENIQFIQSFFDDEFKLDKNVDVIVNSHLFEHIYEPNKFLQQCRAMLKDDGEMIFGVPNMEHLSKISLFLGVFFEHTIFLNKQNITYLLTKNGFDVEEIVDYENHSTIYRTRKSNGLINDGIYPVVIDDYFPQFFTMNAEYKHFIEKCNATIDDSPPNTPVYIFGASYNTQFLLNMGIDETRLSGVLDNCKEKQGKILYGTNLQIVGPETTKHLPSVIVILKNGYYTNENAEQLTKLNANATIVK